MSEPSAPLPVHGFVLAGGKSSRMGRDKALLRFQGRPMVEIAVEKLRSFCANVSIAGNREDLAGFAPVVRETRVDVGPGAGIEAGLLACAQPWAMFLPVDAPLAPNSLLHSFAEAVLRKAETNCVASFLLVNGERQPAFCMVKRTAAVDVADALDKGERSIARLLYTVDKADGGWLWVADVMEFVSTPSPETDQLELWFRNVNTPEELAEAEILAESGETRIPFGNDKTQG